MKTIGLAIAAIVVTLLLGVRLPAFAQEDQPGYYEVSDQAAQGYQPGYYEVSDQGTQGYLLAPDELDNLLAPIALYPDPLIAQILPAATFADQVDAAARYLREYGGDARVDEQPWDVSVRAVAHYPDVLFMMDQKYQWTVTLGQAYVAQPRDVMESIQRLRTEAQAQGNLQSTPQQQVVVQPDAIAIVPASPDYVYVPTYDPQSVYIDPYSPGYPLITFSTGFFIGAWLNRDCDWYRHRVYYHGWRGGGWVGRSRPYIHDRRGIYTGRNASVIRTNTRILQHDTRSYHQQLRGETVRRREGGTLPTRHGRSNLPGPGHVESRQRGTGQRMPQAGGQRSDVFRGRDVQRVQPPSQSGYGGYGTGRDATIYRQRGQSSRQNMQQINRGRSASPQVRSPYGGARPATRSYAPATRSYAPATRSYAPARRSSAPAARPAGTSGGRPAGR